MKPVIAISMIFLSGCAATMETTFNKSNPNAPVNEINGGVVSYLNQGQSYVVTSRRNDAYKKMHDYCSGPYKIVNEGETQGDVSATNLGGVVYYEPSKYWKMKFECVNSQMAYK